MPCEIGRSTQLYERAGFRQGLPGVTSPTSRTDWDVEVRGRLDVDLEPTVVAADARHVSTVAVSLYDNGVVRFRERVQIGRRQEGQGFWSGSLRADRDGRPLLRHRVELGAGSTADDCIAAPRALVSEFRYPAIDCSPATDDWTVLALAGGGTLSTWQANRLAG